MDAEAVALRISGLLQFFELSGDIVESEDPDIYLRCARDLVNQVLDGDDRVAIVARYVGHGTIHAAVMHLLKPLERKEDDPKFKNPQWVLLFKTFGSEKADNLHHDLTMALAGLKDPIARLTMLYQWVSNHSLWGMWITSPSFTSKLLKILGLEVKNVPTLRDQVKGTILDYSNYTGQDAENVTDDAMVMDLSVFKTHYHVHKHGLDKLRQLL